MTLYDSFERMLVRFRPNHPLAPANRFVFAIITPDEPPFAIIVSRESASITRHIDGADYLLMGDSASFAELINPETRHRVELIETIQLRPAYPFKNYLISIFMNAFDFDIEGLDYTPTQLEGTFPFPPRYPVAENRFRLAQYQTEALPVYEAESLCQLIADEHPAWVAMFEKAWQLAFQNLRQPEAESGFVANFIDPAFNANIFMWDSCFMMRFGVYARQHFRFMGTLDNFYAKQADDGFICREINSYTGKDLFQSLDPRSTGPNILAWTEWLNYQHSGDIDRLKAVFPALMAYQRWWQDWRRHPDKSYWTSGWGSGMDNQTRVPHSEYHHRHYSWIDANLQAALNCQTLLSIAAEIGRDEFNQELQNELEFLKKYINQQMWDETSGFYYDRSPDGRLSQTKSIAAFWALLCEIIPNEKAERLIEHLENPASFNRPHPIPTQAYDSADYNPSGGYWLGGVWSPTNYMVLRGLTHRAKHELAHQIAYRHLEQVAQVFENTGTIWENYAPESPQHGIPAQGDFAGWTAVSAISIPLEYLIGLRPKAANESLLWDIRLCERHGVLRYPYGQDKRLDLICEARANVHEVPRIYIKTEAPISLEIHYAEKQKILKLGAGQHRISL